MVVEHMLTQEMKKLPNGIETTNKISIAIIRLKRKKNK